MLAINDLIAPMLTEVMVDTTDATAWLRRQRRQADANSTVFADAWLPSTLPDKRQKAARKFWLRQRAELRRVMSLVREGYSRGQVYSTLQDRFGGKRAVIMFCASDDIVEIFFTGQPTGYIFDGPHGHVVIKNGFLCYYRTLTGKVVIDQRFSGNFAQRRGRRKSAAKQAA